MLVCHPNRRFQSMFIGHFAAGFAAKKIAPRTSLATLLAAAEFVDLLWVAFLLFGWERVRIDPGNTRFTPLDFVYYPWSHSLLTSVLWAAAFGLAYYQITRYRIGSITVAVCVVSHWFLDWVTHRPDMPLYPGSARFGLGLWNSIPAAMAVEIAMFLVGILIYARCTRARDRIGTYGFVAYAVFLMLLYMGDRFGGAPGSVAAIAWTGLLATVILIAWP